MSYYQRLQDSLGTIGAESGAGVGARMAEIQEQSGLEKTIQQMSSSATREQQQATDKMDYNLGGAGFSELGGRALKLARGGGKVAGFNIEGARPANVRIAKQTVADARETMGELGTKGTLRTGEANLRSNLADDIRIRPAGQPAVAGGVEDVRTGQLLQKADATADDLGKVSFDKAQSFRTQNRTRANALSDADKTEVQTRVNNDPNYNANPANETEALQNEFVKQQHIGDVEGESAGTGNTTVGGAQPNAGRTVAGTDNTNAGTQVKDLAGATEEDVSERGGLSVADSALQAGAEKAGAEGMSVIAKGGATLLDVGLDAIPVIGEIASFGAMIGMGITGAEKAKDEQTKQLTQIDQQEAGQLQTEKFGLNRPDFGSMALPSFDVAKNPVALSE
tara:strand:+ start:2155 stop:3336 length:1182 start_codon:yes stop_codon:yes gene_type:complete